MKVKKISYSFHRNIQEGWYWYMNRSIQEEFHLFAEELGRYLSPHVLKRLAQETGFVKRKSKYGARDLAALCIWISQHIASGPLLNVGVK